MVVRDQLCQLNLHLEKTIQVCVLDPAVWWMVSYGGELPEQHPVQVSCRREQGPRRRHKEPTTEQSCDSLAESI